MYETEFQTEVSTAIIDREVDEMTVGITDDELAVLVEVGEIDAAYTADEARELAKSLKCVSDQRWEDHDASTMVEYIRDLATVVDNDMTISEFEQKWSNRHIQTTL